MQMICRSVTHDCPDACSRKIPHRKLAACDILGCTYKPNSLTSCFPYQEPAQPLTNIPGVEFAKEECLLIPVSKFQRVHKTITEMYACDICGKEFRDKEYALQHLEAKHGALCI